MVVVARGLRLVESVGCEIEHVLEACVTWSDFWNQRKATY